MTMASPNQLSFLPDDYLERKARRRANLVCAVLFCAFVVGVGVAGYLQARERSALAEREAAVDSAYNQAAMRIQQVQQMQEKQKRMAHQAELTASLLEKVPRSYLLAEFTNALPAGVSLLDFSLSSTVRQPPAPPAGATRFEQKQAQIKATAAAPEVQPKVYDVRLQLTGIAYTNAQVAQYIAKLAESKLLKDVQLVLVEEFNQQDRKLRKFQLDMRLNGNAAIRPDRNDTRTTAVEVTE